MKTKKYLSIIAIILIVFTYNYSIYAVSQSDVDKLKEEKAEKQEELSNISDEKASETTELDSINSKILELNTEISSLQVKLDELNESISEKQDNIEQKEKDMSDKQELLKKRLVAMYKRGNSSYLDVLLGSSNYIDMIANYDAVKEITNADTSLINQIAEQKKEIESEKAELEEQKTQTETVKAEKDAKNAQLSVVQKEKQTKVANLSAEEKEKQEEIEATDAKIKAAENEMARLWAEAQKKLQEAKSRSSSSSGGASSSSGSGAEGVNFDGSFIWPCSTKIVTSRMKWRWGRQHKGIDIGASHESIYASASGYAYSDYNAGGYGNYIMIYHGDGYVTLYGHLLSVKISQGQYVSQGEVIATSGGAAGDPGRGSSTGAHLHFEIRKASSAADFFSRSPLDPLDYLPGGYTLYD